jgi:hypothetical protein
MMASLAKGLALHDADAERVRPGGIIDARSPGAACNSPGHDTEGMTSMPNQYTAPIPLADRLWPRLIHEDAERVPGLGLCWIWPGARNKTTGYGYLVVKRRGKRWHVDVHRLAYTLLNGPLPSKVFVCHHCDVELCCRPEHLFAGTHTDNMRDMQSKGRGAIGDRNGSRVHIERIPRGDAHYFRLHPESIPRGSARYWRTNLTEADVLEIRRRYAAGGISQARLGKEYGLTQSTIGEMIRRETWTHI